MIGNGSRETPFYFTIRSHRFAEDYGQWVLYNITIYEEQRRMQAASRFRANEGDALINKQKEERVKSSFFYITSLN